MAEKKVSGKTKNNSSRDQAYDDFLVQYGSTLRKRSTKTVNEPVRKNTPAEVTESRCGEIDPHTTVNPTTTHQIFIKRSGRILSDDTGFKAKDYNQRFELTPEMPDLRDDENTAENTAVNAIAGQQTMADLVPASIHDEISVPIEPQISTDDYDAFSDAYKSVRSETKISFGKSEKLRAIARTAADDAGMEPENQLSFPSFDPLFKFPEENNENKKTRKKIKIRHIKPEPKEKQIFDIDEKEIVTKTAHTEEAPTDSKEESKADVADRKNRFFEFLTASESSREDEPPFEIGGKNEIRNTLNILTKHSRVALIKTTGLLICSIFLMIILLVTDDSRRILQSTLSFMFLIISGAICISEIIDGVKDIGRKKISLNSCILMVLASAILQTAVSFFASSDFVLLAPAAIITMAAVTIPKFFLSNNAKLTSGLLLAENVSVFRTAAESGIDGAVKERLTNGLGELRYSSKAMFVTGIMKKLTNAIPRPFGINAANITVLIFAFIAAVASGIISSGIMAGITAFTGIVITCLPVSYVFTAAVLLYNANSILAKNKSSLISYKCAANITDTKGIVFNASDIIEKSACSIHGVKAFSHTDPQKATLYCAAAINAANSPLTYIMKQVTDQGDVIVPNAESVEIFASKGIQATVENCIVHLGSREFLKENGIYVPEENYEEKFLTGDRKLLYFAMDGRFSMLLIVSYHIKRSIAAFFKYLTANDIRLVIHSSDPNITPSYIMKKCKLPEASVYETENAEAAYFSDKEKRTETALPAEVFTDGSMKALSELIRSAFTLNKTIELLPFVIYVMSAFCAILIAATVFLNSAATIGNIFVILLRTISFFVSIGAVRLLTKQK